jgi:LacI family transcriptional regulator
LGHKRIAFMVAADIRRTDLHYSIYDRRQGYEDAMQEAGLRPQILALPKVPHTMDEIRADDRLKIIADMLLAARRPTAIVAYSSNIVVPVLQVAAQLGLHLPRDLSVVVFADTPSQEIGRPVTTVCLKMSSVGNEAVKMLLQKIQEPSQPQASLPITPWFFQGNTSGPPP